MRFRYHSADNTWPKQWFPTFSNFGFRLLVIFLTNNGFRLLVISVSDF
jgi:hypothetical protein